LDSIPIRLTSLRSPSTAKVVAPWRRERDATPWQTCTVSVERRLGKSFSVGRELRLGKPSELNRSREGCRAVALQSDAKADTLPVPPALLLASHVEGLLT